MLKAAIQILLAFSIPVLLYMLWTLLRGGRPAPGWLAGAPWTALLASGLALAALALGLLAVLGGDDPEGVFVPAHVVDGKVVPSSVKP